MANAIIYDNKRIADLLAEKNWKLLKGKDPGRIGGSIVVRYVEHKADDIDPDAWKLILAFLAKWTSAANYVTDSSPASSIVVSPMVEGRVETGTFYKGEVIRERGPSERVPQGHWRIIQTLYKGGADTETEYISENGCQYTIYRKYYVEQLTMPDIPANSSGVETSRSFQVDPVTGFYNGYTERRVRLYQTVPEFYSMQDAFAKVQRTKHLGIRADGKDESGSVISIPDPSSGTDAPAGVTIQLDKNKNSDCTFDATVDKKTTIPKLNAVVSDRKTKFATETTALDKDQTSATTPPVFVAGSVKTVTTKYTEAKQYDNELRTETPVPVEAAIESKTYTAFETRTDVVDRNTVVDPTLPSSFATAGTIITKEDEITDAGAHNVKTSTRVAVAANSGSYTSENTAFKTVSAVEHHNAASVPSASLNEAVRGDINELGKFDYSKTTITPVAATAANTSKVSAFQSVASTVAHNSATLPNAAANEEVRGDINPEGKYDYNKNVVTPIEANSGTYTSESTAFKTVAAVEHHNAASVPNASANQSIRGDINAEGKFDYSQTTITPLAASASNTSEITAFKSISTEVHHNASSLPNAGSNIRIQGDINAEGKYDYTKQSLTPAAANSGTYTSQNNTFQTAQTTEYHNANSIPDALANQQVRGDINEAGKYDYSLTAITPVAATDSYISNLDEYTKVTTTKAFNASGVPDAAIGQRVNGAPNADGKFDYVLDAEAPVSGLIGSGVSAVTFSIKGEYYHEQTFTHVSKDTAIDVNGVRVKEYDYLAFDAKMQMQIDYSRKYYATEAEAIAYMTGGYQGSSFSRVRPGLWEAIKTAQNPQLVSVNAISYPDPYADARPYQE